MEHGRSQGDRRSSQDRVQTGVLPGVLAADDSSTPVQAVPPVVRGALRRDRGPQAKEEG